MKRNEIILLFLISLTFYCGVAWFQHLPGYMDADYYFAGGLRLAQGHGFTETYLWNYLDNPQQLPHPSHAYWFPLASILAATGMFITGQATFWAARLGFIFAAALVAPVTASLCFQISSSRENSIAAGLLAVFSGYYVTYLPTTDNFGIFMLLGGLFFLLLPRGEKSAPFFLGLVAGLLNLARADGFLWLVIGLIGLFLYWLGSRPRLPVGPLLLAFFVFVFGYLLVMGAWLLRNLMIWGTPFTPAGSKLLWLTSYEQTFAWPASQINLQNWLASGWSSILASRLDALSTNLLNTIGAQGGILLFPLILAGLWSLRKDLRIRLAVLVWVILFAVMSVFLPFAGSRGSFFHAGSALQPVWYAASVLGLDVLVSKARARGWFTPAALTIFRFALVVFMACLTIFLAYNALIRNDWNQFLSVYGQTETILVQNGAQPQDVVIVSNPPGYYIVTGRSAIAVPSLKPESLHALAAQFGARFLVLEKNYYSNSFIPIYLNPRNQPGLTFLSEFDGIRIFLIKP